MKHFGPELNTGKNRLVVGTNEAGIHGAGAAREALQYWGAVIGTGLGEQGQSYAIPTKDREIKTLPLERIKIYVNSFILYANEHPELTFLVTPIGTGLAGLKHEEIAPMFKHAPDNCVLPDEWIAIQQKSKA